MKLPEQVMTVVPGAVSLATMPGNVTTAELMPLAAEPTTFTGSVVNAGGVVSAGGSSGMRAELVRDGARRLAAGLMTSSAQLTSRLAGCDACRNLQLAYWLSQNSHTCGAPSTSYHLGKHCRWR